MKAIFPALVFALFMTFIYPNTQWDVQISNQFFDVQQQQFVLKHQPFLADWMHEKLKWLMAGIALVSLFLAFLAYQYPTLKPYQRSFLWGFVGMVVSTSVVAALKSQNMHGCPWSLSLYGGDLPLLALFSKLPLGVEAGHCFPAGHPSGGFALMAFYFAFRRGNPHFATAMLCLGLMLGLVMGFVQIMRGAHFLSHVLWSGWVVWAVLLVLYAVWQPEKPSATFFVGT